MVCKKVLFVAIACFAVVVDAKRVESEAKNPKEPKKRLRRIFGGQQGDDDILARIGDLIDSKLDAKLATLAARVDSRFDRQDLAMAGVAAAGFKSEDRQQRTSACVQAGSLAAGMLPYLPDLVELLKDEYTSVRKAASEALAKLGGAGVDLGAVFPTVVEMFKNAKPAAREGACSSAGAFGEAMRPHLDLLIELLSDSNESAWRGPTVGEAAAKALADLQAAGVSMEATDVLAILRGTKKLRCRLAGSLGDAMRPHLTLVVEMLKNDDEDERECGWRIVGDLGATAWQQHRDVLLEQLMKVNGWGAQKNAKMALKNFHAAGLLEVSDWIPLLGSEWDGLARIAQKALSKLRDDGVDLETSFDAELVAAAKDAGVELLTYDTIVRGLDSKDISVRTRACKLAGGLGAAGRPFVRRVADIQHEAHQTIEKVKEEDGDLWLVEHEERMATIALHKIENDDTTSESDGYDSDNSYDSDSSGYSDD